jgi:hypothetical protein
MLNTPPRPWLFCTCASATLLVSVTASQAGGCQAPGTAHMGWLPPTPLKYTAYDMHVQLRAPSSPSRRNTLYNALTL